MTVDSAALTIALDVLIVAALVYALREFQKHKRSVLVKELRTDFLLIAAGLGMIGVSYVCDLLSKHFVPKGADVQPGALLAGFEFLHHEVFWALVPGGAVLIAIGFAKSITRASGLIAELKAQEGQVYLAGQETDSVRSKLDQREAELGEQNRRFQAAMENMSQGLCMFDKEQRLIVSNARYASMYGLSKELVKSGTTFRQILEYRIRNNVFVGDDPEEYIQERLKAVSEGEASTKIQLLADGRVLAIAHRPLPDGGWVATHEDISELAKAETMNQRLARIVENAINEIYVCDAETLTFIQVNKSACKNLGYTMEELSELTPLDIKADCTPESFEKLIEPLRKNEKAHIQYETEHLRKDGTRYDAKVTLQQIRSQNQRVFAAIIEDVTEKKQVDRELKQSQEMFLKAFQANPVPFSISGPGGEIYDVNEAWLNTLGYTRDEVIGHSALKLGIWANPEERAGFVALLKEQGTVEDYETQYRTRDGETRDMVVSGEWVEVRGEPRMFNISHDVTERKATERQLLEDRDTLQELVNRATAGLKAKARELEAALAREKELNELQRQFVSMASHEFRTPLAIIDSTAQRLKKIAGASNSDDVLKRVDKIRGAVERMTRLMESTLTAARLEEGKIAVEIQSCDIARIVKEVCARHQEFAKNHVISCQTRDLPKTIRADAGALDQMINNLVSNAIKYSPSSPDVQVEAHGVRGHVVIKVRDHGLGIDEEDLPKMFARFFRARTSTGIVGTGIGLNLVKTLVEMHGGTICVDSKKNEGSTFTLRLPVDGPPARPEPVWREKAPQAGERAA